MSAMFNPHSALANKAALTAPIAIAVKKTRLTSRALSILTDATHNRIPWFPGESFGENMRMSLFGRNHIHIGKLGRCQSES